MAGPWFTVHKNGEWTELGQVWISNGQEDCKGMIEMKVELARREEQIARHDLKVAEK